MKTRTLLQHRQTLVGRLAELDEALALIKSEIETTTQNQTSFLKDAFDHTREQTDLKAHLNLNEHYMNERRQIVAAIDRVELGQFGHCLECGDEISVRRLMVQPAASHCLECQCLKEGHTGLVIATVHKLKTVGAMAFMNTTPLEVA